ncbi:MAG: phosphoethanolamine transferase [Paucimonas sp.]|nr:phosphoethanolamine transferase [Paucimonas sp.]
MPLTLNPASLFLLGTYLLLSAVPFLSLAMGKPVANSYHLAGAAIFAWATVWAVFRRPAIFHILLLPAFIAVPVQLYLVAYFGQDISAHHLGIILETSPKEAAEFLGNRIWLLGLVAMLVLAWFTASWWIAIRTRALDWTDGSRWIILALLAAGYGMWAYGLSVGVHAPPAAASATEAGSSASPVLASASEAGEDEDEPVDADASLPSPLTAITSALPKLPGWAAPPLDAAVFGRSWPFGLAMPAHEFYKERKYLAELADRSKAFKFGASQAGAAQTPQVVVMVLGESSRFDRWSLNGYRRETNPLLKREANLVSLADMVTAVSATRLSVPVILSRKPATQSLKAGFSEKSFMTAYKEAGFKTYWLSNQMSFGQFDTPVSVFAKEADVVQFLNPGGYTDRSSLDSALLDPLKAALRDPAPKKLLVLHSLGNHWNYSHRYPKEFDKWQPSLFGVKDPAYTDLALKASLNNSYDNSILYTDWFLSQVIASLKGRAEMTSMMYVADHGQTLYDGSCDLAFHGHNTQYEFHVPALVWYSDQYKETFPEKVSRLQRNRRAKLATENVFHSLLDMSDIRYASEQLDRSLFSNQLRRHKRYVDSYGWTDYDNARFKGDCREVIAKGKPLPQD